MSPEEPERWSEPNDAFIELRDKAIDDHRAGMTEPLFPLPGTTNPLLRLPSGDYVRASEIRSVVVLPASAYLPGSRNKVIVKVSDHYIPSIDCDSLADAQRVRDEIAEMVRKAEGTEEADD